MKEKPFRIAITGKGGSGKTSITVLLAKALIENRTTKLLLVDADPTHPHLCDMVDLNPHQTIEKIRKNLIQSVYRNEKVLSKIAQDIDFEVYNAIQESKHFSLFSLGQPEGPGCFCPSNTILRNVIDSISHDFDIVLIDCEAGLEQIHRQVLKSIHFLIIVVDLSMRSVETARSIKSSAKKFTNSQSMGVIVNKSLGDITPILNKIEEFKLSLIGTISDDPLIKNFDLMGKPLIYLPETSTSFREMKLLIDRIFPS
ncbi:MAG: AAA family ATPase [Promethearchaeota archaeon]